MQGKCKYCGETVIISPNVGVMLGTDLFCDADHAKAYTSERTKVYYSKKGSFNPQFFQYNNFDMDDNTFLPIAWLNQQWKLIPVMFKLGKDKIFANLNSDDNPMGTPANQNWLRANGVAHTSMSVGDLVQVDKDFWVCGNKGWLKVVWIK